MKEVRTKHVPQVNSLRSHLSNNHLFHGWENQTALITSSYPLHTNRNLDPQRQNHQHQKYPHQSYPFPFPFPLPPFPHSTHPPLARLSAKTNSRLSAETALTPSRYPTFQSVQAAARKIQPPHTTLGTSFALPVPSSPATTLLQPLVLTCLSSCLGL